jgi:cytochrome oxidase Cu insertion factor (SCO1/SenC/PrrC family)
MVGRNYRGQAWLALAASLSMSQFVGIPAASAHGTVVHEETKAVPVDPGYEAPAPASLGGKPFTLTDHTGRTVTDATFKGRWRLMFFGFAGCREACPAGLDRMALALQELGPAGERIQPLFVDLDFAGPDLKGLAQFVGNFHPRLLGLTGDRRQMYDILRDFRVRREIKHAAQGKKETGPRIDHSTTFFLVDPDGRTRTYFYHTLQPAEMAAHIKKYL